MEQRAESLNKRIRDRARRAAQSVEQRQTLLQLTRERLNAESGEERDVTLQQLRELARDRRAAQSSEQREATLLHMRELGYSSCNNCEVRLAPHHMLYVTSTVYIVIHCHV